MKEPDVVISLVEYNQLVQYKKHYESKQPDVIQYDCYGYDSVAFLTESKVIKELVGENTDLLRRVNELKEMLLKKKTFWQKLRQTL